MRMCICVCVCIHTRVCVYAIVCISECFYMLILAVCKGGQLLCTFPHTLSLYHAYNLCVLLASLSFSLSALISQKLSVFPTNTNTNEKKEKKENIKKT